VYTGTDRIVFTKRRNGLHSATGDILRLETAYYPCFRKSEGTIWYDDSVVGTRAAGLGHFFAGIFKQSMGARNRVGRGLSYWPARLHSLVELVPWN
jgi:hypothetical protein